MARKMIFAIKLKLIRIRCPSLNHIELNIYIRGQCVKPCRKGNKRNNIARKEEFK